jgi:xanthine dehydrogenase YagR molybdenum-binding subunit
MEHNNPMEPHTCVAVAADDRLTLYSSTQGVHDVRTAIAAVFGLDEDAVRVIAPHVGGGFGSKGVPHAHDVLAVMAARRSAGRPVKLALTRQQMFALVGYRTPTIQRVRLAADDDGTLAAIGHEVVEVTSRWKEFAEQTAVPSRILYAASSRATCHRLVPLDVAAPSWMRAPGEMPGMFAAEVAIDELAIACGVDPIELRIRNDPPSDPESGLPWSGRHLVECLREGARRFDWERRRAKPAERRANGWLVGLGVASSTYPRYILPGSRATIRYLGDGRYTVAIGAVDIGTGTWTALAQIAADALGRPFEAVRLEIGDSELPHGSVEGGSSGISSWGGAVVAAARAFRDEHGLEPAPGAEATAATPEDSAEGKFSTHSFGAQFAEVHVREDSGEVRVPRLLGVFSVGRIINPRTARSQLIGGMTMGLSAALHEESILDPRFGHVVNHDLAGYHVATHADVKNVEAIWLDECDEHSNAMGSRGIGEIGIVGTAAAIANAVCHATGVRIRSLPITLDKLVGSLR